MRICLHTIWEVNQQVIGGTERFLIDISKELLALGHEPFIVCSSLKEHSIVEGIDVYGIVPSEYYKAYCRYSSVNPAFIKNEILGDADPREALEKLSAYTKSQLKSVKADVFHLNSFASASYIYPWAPSIITNHENERESDRYWGDGFFSSMGALIRQRKTQLHTHDFLIAPSNYYAKKFARLFELDVQGVNLGICLNHFLIKNAHENKDESQKIVALLPSRFDMYQKGHDIAIIACSILRSKGVDIEMIFTGLRDDYKDSLSKFASLTKEYNVTKHIKVTRYDNIQDGYNLCDIIISPERYCSYGLSISEALSLSIPTVLSDIPTYREIAKDFNHAFFFKNESPEDLARNILKASEVSRKSCREDTISFRIKYDLRNCAKTYSKLYNQAIRNNTSP